MENKFKDGKIYKLIDNTNGNIYYGSTIQKLNVRLIKHKSDFTQFIRNKSCSWYQSFRILINNDFKIELIENYPCNSHRKLQERENYYIINFKNINKHRSYISLEEKKTVRHIYNKKYRENLSDEKRAEINARQVINSKKYEENMSEEKKAKKKAKKAISDKKRHDKDRSEKNDLYKKQLKAKNELCKKIVNCPKCNKSFRYDNLSKHRKTKYCLNYIESSA